MPQGSSPPVPAARVGEIRTAFLVYRRHAPALGASLSSSLPAALGALAVAGGRSAMVGLSGSPVFLQALSWW